MTHFKKFLSAILAFSIISQTPSVHCETHSKFSKSTTILGTLLGISGIATACLTIALIDKIKNYQSKSEPPTNIQEKFNGTPVNNEDKLNVELRLNRDASEELHQVWYATYYCATTGLISSRNDWLAITQKCLSTACKNQKTHQSIVELLKYSKTLNISEFDLIFNILTATYLSKNLPEGILDDTGIPLGFSRNHWLYCCNFKISDDSSINDASFEICKNLTIGIFTDMLSCFDTDNPNEARLCKILQTEFIDVLQNVE